MIRIKVSMYLPCVSYTAGLLLSQFVKLLVQGCEGQFLSWILDRGVVDRSFQPLRMVQSSSSSVCGLPRGSSTMIWSCFAV